MALRTISYNEAFNNSKRDRFSNWPNRADPENRLEPICAPSFKPTFSLTPGDKVFTIGSCFARNVEQALATRGFDVVTRKIAEPGALFERFGPNILNNFAAPSIFNELDWALGDASAFEEGDNFFEITPGQFIDIHVSNAIRPSPLEVVRARRAAITAVTRQVVDCSIVILTLGLAEVWYDAQTARYLNTAPIRALSARYPDRFELHVLDYDIALKFLRATLSLLRAKCGDAQRVLLTVSPVPLITTFTGQDVLVANCYSKSLLRTVCEVAAFENDHIDYYPSYESVTLSDRKIAWRDDLHHVEPALIHLNVERMISAYSTPPADDGNLQAALAEAAEFSEGRDPRGAMRCLEPFIDRLSRMEDRLFYADLCARVGRHGDALAILKELPAGVGGWPRRVAEGRVLLSLGQKEEALQHALAMTTDQPKRLQGWKLLAETRVARSELEDAVVAAKRWAEINIRSGQPLRLLAEIYRHQQKFDSADAIYRKAIGREVSSQRIVLDYADFLIEQKRFDEAKAMLKAVSPESRANKDRLEALLLYVM